jgi:hypothetical protein
MLWGTFRILSSFLPVYYLLFSYEEKGKGGENNTQYREAIARVKDEFAPIWPSGTEYILASW